MEAYEVIVDGRVQGVGYRYFAVNQAHIYQIIGCVKNLYDGRVKIIAEGKEKNIQLFIKQLHQGPRLAHVTNIKTSPFVGKENFSDFAVRL